MNNPGKSQYKDLSIIYFANLIYLWTFLYFLFYFFFIGIKEISPLVYNVDLIGPMFPNNILFKSALVFPIFYFEKSAHLCFLVVS